MAPAVRVMGLLALAAGLMLLQACAVEGNYYETPADCKKAKNGSACHHPNVYKYCLSPATCQNYKCVPGASTCTASPCKKAWCKHGKCKYSWVKDYTSCETDADKCTVEHCVKGVCKAKYTKDCSHDYPHYDKQCQYPPYCKGGKCYPPAPMKDDTHCESDDKCYVAKCKAGACKPLYAKDCKQEFPYYDKQCASPPTCNPKTGHCEAPQQKQNGVKCEADHDKCTIDACDGGLCKAKYRNKCKGVAYDPHCEHAPWCKPRTGKCVVRKKEDGTECGADGSCSIKKCYKGKCRKTDYEKDCAKQYTKPYDKQCSYAPYCNDKDGLCVPPAPKANGTACDADYNPCTLDVCYARLCTKGPVNDCKDTPYDKQCQDKPYCDERSGKCKVVDKDDHVDCELYNYKCALAKCQKGECKPTKEEKDCEKMYPKYDKQCSYAPYCNDKDGLCVPPAPKANGTHCDADYNPCTLDVCYAGYCAKGPVNDCKDTPCDKQCQEAYCDHESGKCKVVDKDEHVECELDNTCYLAKCRKGECKPTKEEKCMKQYPKYDKQCSYAPYCDKAKGVCIPPAPKANGTHCDTDGDACTLDACYAGVCKYKDALDCSHLASQCRKAPYCKRGVCKKGDVTPLAPCGDGYDKKQCDDEGKCKAVTTVSYP